MKKIIGLLLCALAACFAVACQPDSNDNGDQKAGPWAQFSISAESCSDFKNGFDDFKYENDLSLVLPDFSDVNCKSRYLYYFIINLETKEDLNNFEVDYPQFVFEEFDDENIVKIYGESFFIFGTAEYVLENPEYELSGEEEDVKTYDVICGDLTLLTVSVQLSENAEDILYDTVLQQIVSSLTVL